MPMGPVTIHLLSWSSANTINATAKPRRYLAIQNLFAAVIELAVRLHLRHEAPAAAALVVAGLGHLELIAFVNGRHDEQLCQLLRRCREVRQGDFGLEARADHLLTPHWLDR